MSDSTTTTTTTTPATTSCSPSSAILDHLLELKKCIDAHFDENGHLSGEKFQKLIKEIFGKLLDDDKNKEVTKPLMAEAQTYFEKGPNKEENAKLVGCALELLLSGKIHIKENVSC